MSEFLRDKLLFFASILILLLGLACFGYVGYRYYTAKTDFSQYGKDHCVKAALVREMQDGFLTGIIEKHQEFMVLENYYECNPIQREDRVWFRYSPNLEPVVKIIRGLPGDYFEVLRDEEREVWHIRINGRFMMSGKDKYYIDIPNEPPIKVYEKARKGKLRDGEYLILSTLSPGDSDSGYFGLVRKHSFVGRVFPMLE